jgi:hypothetical protein
MPIVTARRRPHCCNHSIAHLADDIFNWQNMAKSCVIQPTFIFSDMFQTQLDLARSLISVLVDRFCIVMSGGPAYHRVSLSTTVGLLVVSQVFAVRSEHSPSLWMVCPSLWSPWVKNSSKKIPWENQLHHWICRVHFPANLQQDIARLYLDISVPHGSSGYSRSSFRLRVWRLCHRTSGWPGTLHLWNSNGGFHKWGIPTVIAGLFISWKIPI